jgi:hypothetical protein
MKTLNIILTVTFICGVKLQIQPIEPGIYVEKLGAIIEIEENFCISVKIDILKIEQEFGKLTKVGAEIISKCKEYNEAFPEESPICRKFTNKISILEQAIAHDLKLIRNKPGARTKRGLFNFVGEFASFWTGLTSDAQRNEILQKIERLESNIDEGDMKLYDVSQKFYNESTRLIDLTLNELEKIKFDTLNLKNELEKGLSEELANICIQANINLYMLIFDTINKKASDIFNIVTAAYNDKISPQLIGTQEILDEMAREPLPRDLKWPITPSAPDLHLLNKIVKTLMLSKNNCIYILIKIPKISSRYDLLKLIPVPEIIEQKFVYAKTPTLIIPNKTRNKFINIEPIELNKCINYNDDFYCSQLANFETDNCLHMVLTAFTSNQCDMMTLKTEKNFLIIKINFNKYAIITDQPLRGSIVDQNMLRTITIDRSSIVQFRNRTTLIINNIELNFHKEDLNVHETEFETISFNLENSIETQIEKIELSPYDKQFLNTEQLHKYSKELKVEAEIRKNLKKRIIFHNVTTALITTAICIFVCIIIIAVLFYKYAIRIKMEIARLFSKDNVNENVPAKEDQSELGGVTD